MQLAIDVGSGFTKYTNGKTTDSIPSVVCPFESNGEFGVSEDEVITYSKGMFLTGDSAVYFGDTPEKRLSTLTEEWAGSEGWLALIYRVIGEIGVTSGEIDLITGVPQAYFSRDKQKISAALNGRHTFMFRGIEHDIEISTTLIPQAAATLFYLASNDDSVLDDFVGCIDIGTYTTGFSVIDGMNFVKRLNGGVPVGMSDVYKKLEYNLARIGFKTDPSKMDSIITRKSIRHQGESMAVEEDVRLSIVDVASTIKEAVRKQWGDVSDMQVYVTGGGAKHFFDSLRESIRHLKMMDDPFFAVAKGMLVYLENQKQK